MADFMLRKYQVIAETAGEATDKAIAAFEGLYKKRHYNVSSVQVWSSQEKISLIP